MKQQKQQQDDCWNNNNNRRSSSNKFVLLDDSCLELDELPSPQELMPLTQSLITPDLALAFNIHPQSSDAAAVALDDQARTLKRPRLVWTPQLHKRFVDAVAHLGIKNAVPKTIMQLMSVDGLTRENVASHLQKYRLYLKRMQGGGGGLPSNSASSDAAMDRLFASSPVPPQFLHPIRSNSDHHFIQPYPPIMPPIHLHQQQQQQHFRHFGNPHHFDNPFIRQQQQQQPHMQILRGSSALKPVYVEDLDSPRDNKNKILTLFPTGGLHL